MIRQPEEYLALSGIQHYAYCPRQWALIHVEKQWEENARTFGGRVMHERADDPFVMESRGDTLIVRSIPLVCHALGIYGVADVVEYRRREGGVSLPTRRGKWFPYPVEYKYGQPKKGDFDEVQLCAQAMCLEEMYADQIQELHIEQGYLFYGRTRHRETIELDEGLRKRVQELVACMWADFDRGITPPARYQKGCKACSLVDVCMPKLTSKSRSAQTYLQNAAQEDAP